MKRYLTMLLIISLCIFVFTGCSKKIEDLSSTNKIEITKFSTTSDNDNVYSVTVDNDEQVKYICDNLNSLTMKKMGYNKPTEKAYTLTFYSSARKIQTISITAHGWIDYNGDFHNVVVGELDIDYIDSLLKDATPSNGDNEVPNDPQSATHITSHGYVLYVSEDGFVTHINAYGNVFVKNKGSDIIDIFDTVIIEYYEANLFRESGSFDIAGEIKQYSYMLEAISVRVADPSKGDLVFG